MLGPDGRGTIYSLIVIHPHIDHTRHLMRVLHNFNVLNFVEGGGKRGSGQPQLKPARNFVTNKNILYNRIADDEILEDGYTTSHLAALRNAPSIVDVRFLSGYRQNQCEDENNDSLTLRVKYGQKTFIFAGDAEDEDKWCKPQIDNLLEWFEGTLLDVDVYKVDHHGSHNGTNKRYLHAMSPEVAVISAGHRNVREPGGFHAFQFGHPREETLLELLESTTGTRPQKNVYSMDAAGTRKPIPGKPVFRDITEAVYCTCWDGDVIVSTDKNGTRLAPVVTTGYQPDIIGE